MANIYTYTTAAMAKNKADMLLAHLIDDGYTAEIVSTPKKFRVEVSTRRQALFALANYANFRLKANE